MYCCFRFYTDMGTERQQDERMWFNIETAGEVRIEFIPGA